MSSSASAQAWRSMRELMSTGEGHRQVHAASAAAGVSPGLLKMAMHLSRDEPLAMRDLARRFSVDASYVTSVVDGLEQAGIAERRPHPRDRRIKTVALTERGAAVLVEVNAVFGTPPAAFDVLDPQEQEQLEALLSRVVDAARSEIAAADQERASDAVPAG